MSDTRYFVFVNRPDGGSGLAGFIGEFETVDDALAAKEQRVAVLLGYHPNESISFEIVRYIPGVEFHILSTGWQGPVKNAKA